MHLEMSAKQTVEMSIPPRRLACALVLGQSRASGGGGGTDALVPLQMAGSIFISSCMFNHPPVVHTSKSQLESMSGKDDLILLSYSKAQVH